MHRGLISYLWSRSVTQITTKSMTKNVHHDELSFICAVTEACRFKLTLSSAKSSGACETDKLLNADLGPESDPES